jgi:hypothetical protein
MRPSGGGDIDVIKWSPRFANLLLVLGTLASLLVASGAGTRWR